MIFNELKQVTTLACVCIYLELHSWYVTTAVSIMFPPDLSWEMWKIFKMEKWNKSVIMWSASLPS